MEKSIHTKQYKQLVKKLREAREEAGLQQAQVAKILKRAQSYVSKVESGQIRLDVFQLLEFAKIYNKTLNDFVK